MLGWIEKRYVAVSAFALMSLGILVSLYFQIRGGVRGIPLRGFDDIMYTTPILEYANTGLLNNPHIQFGDTTKFIWHGWLTPMLLGSLPGAGDPTLVGVTMVFAAFASVILLAVLLFRRGITWEGALLLPAIFVAQLYNTNRPELVSTPLLIVAMLLLLPQWKREPIFSVGFVIAIAIIAVAHPHIAFLCCFATGLVLLAQAPKWSWLLMRVAGYGISIVALIAIMTEIHPQVGFTEWIAALYGMGTKVAGMEAGAFFFQYYIASPMALLVVAYLAAIVLAAAAIAQKSLGDEAMPGRRMLLYVGIAAYFVVIWFFCIRTPHVTYLLGLAAPLIWALHSAAREPGNVLRIPAQLLILTIGGAACLSLAYRTVATEVSVRQGIPVAQYASEIRALDGVTGRIGTNISMVNETVRALSGHHIVSWPRWDMFPPTRPTPDFYAPPPVVIIAQANTGGAGAPKPPPGYRVVIERFHRDRPSLFGWAIGSTYKDYAYAVLCRHDYCPALMQQLTVKASRSASRTGR